MNLRNRNDILFGAAIAAVLILVAGYAVWLGATKPGFKPFGRAATTSPATTTQQVSSTTIIVTTPGGKSYTISQIPIEQRPTPPDYKKPIACASSVSADFCADIQSRIAKLVIHIDQNPTSFPAWVDLGTAHIEAGDITGATAAWNYVTKLYPTNATAYGNLGALYMQEKNYPKAEADYLIAIKYAPKDINLYSALFQLYTTTSYVPTASAAENILKKGIVANPTAVSLQVQLARYYRSAGRAVDANATYDAAIASAKAQGQNDLAAQLTVEKTQ